MANSFLQDLKLVEPPAVGRRFSWTNGQADPIWVKLDRFIVNDDCARLFPKLIQNSLPRLGSDHVPIRLEFECHHFVPRPFRYELAWSTNEEFESHVRKWWEECVPTGCGAFILAKKLIFLRGQLRHWAKFSFGSIKLRKLALLLELDKLDSEAENRILSHSESKREEDLRIEMSMISKQEELYWKQRSRLQWLKEGDDNTRFFHMVANGRKNRNFIPSINLNGTTTTDSKEIGKVFACQFQHQFGQKALGSVHDRLRKLLSNRNYVDLSHLERPLTLEEVKGAILATRLGDVINVLIDSDQSAFLKGRCILDNIATAEELIFSLHKRNLPGHILKVDFAKAFDVVDWDFIFDLLSARGFGARWVGWIKCILASSKASILVNGSPNGYIRYHRGLRQGDPLSPLLFVLVTDVLSSMFAHALSSKVLVGVPLGSFGRRCNLHYADDLLILTAGGCEDLRIIKLILYLFEGMSGLETNFSKTCLFSSRPVSRLVMRSEIPLQVKVGLLPVVYLGIPISGRRPRKQDWEGVILKVRKRLAAWKLQHLSLGGRLILVNSVLSAIPTSSDVHFPLTWLGS
ncbi:uncharacterized protein LOC120261424 [Dioscorea cayenensis subsp. rotundata]|uniref:Uncharacterized protein LOC120261424 n=1 Tax=Dioscorea cayennensis subsp. rotundata TaxID=55577 RepID=A0AB40BDR2_DIOCR|nr:uncharacterized protein LOC120261424 [Dioscorea cayenensis subsp. rotundata]